MPRTAPVDPVRLLRLIEGTRCAHVSVVDETTSTNADLMALAVDGAAEGTVIVAEHQTAGRGRFDRAWGDTAGSSIAMSVLVRPHADMMSRWGWLPLIAGMAVREGIAQATGLTTQIKWPNDVLVATGPCPGKLVGILAELASTPTGPACIVGMGINVAMSGEELPVDTATSITLSGIDAPDKTEIVAAILRAWDGLYARWVSKESLAAEYVAGCSTIGREVRVQLDSQRGLGEIAHGVATGIDAEGSLLVRVDEEIVALSAGDVVHVR